MVRVAPILLGVASGGAVAYAFHLPSVSRSAPTTTTCRAANGCGNRHSFPPRSSPRARGPGLRLSKDEGDADLAEEIESLDADLAVEIEEAFTLAQDALSLTDVVDAEEERDAPPREDEIDEIATMLLERPPMAPPPPAMPAPPAEEPPASVVSLGLEEEVVDAVPPESPPPAEEEEEDDDFGEVLRRKWEEEMEKLQKLVFGVEEELAEAESGTKEEQDTAAALKKEIEESLNEREEMVKKIEIEFNSEKEQLVAQLAIASDELKEIMDQSERNITEAKSEATVEEKELIARLDSFKAAIDEVTASTMEINKDKESIQQSKQSVMDNILQEGKERMARFRKSFQFDVEYAKQVNSDLVRRAEEAEQKVRSVYDQITQTRTKRVSLQQQIADVERNALEEVEKLQRELEADDERYAAALQRERERMDGVIDVAYQAYAIKVCKKIVERQGAEADYEEKLRQVNMQVVAGREKQEARVKEYLDKLEEKHEKERVAIYKEKFEAVSAIRDQMNAELEIEYKLIEETHKTNRARIDAVKKQTMEIKAEFKKEMEEKRQLAKEEETELLDQIEDIRVDMTDKMKTQRRLYSEQRAVYLADMNAKISESEVELRQKWRELAGVKQSYGEVRAERDGMLDEVAGQQELIDEYESDRGSFRKSLRLTARVAREKIGSKTRRLLRRGEEKYP